MREKLFLHTLHTKGFELWASSLLDAIIELRSLGSCSLCPSVAGKGRAPLSSTIVSTIVSSCGLSVIWSTDMASDQDVMVVR